MKHTKWPIITIVSGILWMMIGILITLVSRTVFSIPLAYFAFAVVAIGVLISLFGISWFMVRVISNILER